MYDKLNLKKLIKISDFEQLSIICWNRDKSVFLTEEDALSLYERNWIHIDKNKISINEQKLIDRLIIEYGNGVFNV